jgi:hypothetical protein
MYGRLSSIGARCCLSGEQIGDDKSSGQEQSAVKTGYCRGVWRDTINGVPLKDPIALSVIADAEIGLFDTPPVPPPPPESKDGKELAPEPGYVELQYRAFQALKRKLLPIVAQMPYAVKATMTEKPLDDPSPTPTNLSSGQNPTELVDDSNPTPCVVADVKVTATIDALYDKYIAPTLNVANKSASTSVIPVPDELLPFAHAVAMKLLDSKRVKSVGVIYFSRDECLCQYYHCFHAKQIFVTHL